MRYSLKTKLTISYMLIVVIVVGLISLVANITIREQFQDYVIEKQEKQTNEILELIRMKYEEDKDWDMDYLGIIGMNALEKGMIIEIFDESDQMIWSAYEHNNGLCQMIITNMITNMHSYSGNWDGEFQEKTYPITSKNKMIGSVKTGYVGPFYFDDEELIFIKALNHLFLLIGICSLLLAFVLGFVMSYHISNPLNKIAKKAVSLSQGKYKERLCENSNTKEIQILTETINKLSDALEGKEKLTKQLTQDVAHELRTPLTSVQGHMEAMIDGIWPMDKERLSSCYDEILRIRRLIGSIEDLSGVENDNVLLHKEEFDVLKLLERLLNNYENDLLQKKMNVDYLQKKVIIYADQDKMSQVLNNLISNAIKYSKEGGNILVTLNNHHKTSEIKVLDSGIGIEDTDLPYIFDRFYRVDQSRNSKTGGVGVGLTITKSIIEAHGGTITVSSKIGEGTEFTITLPNK